MKQYPAHHSEAEQKNIGESVFQLGVIVQIQKLCNIETLGPSR